MRSGDLAMMIGAVMAMVLIPELLLEDIDNPGMVVKVVIGD